MAVVAKIAIARILVDLNLAVRYGIAIRYEILADFNLAVIISTAKLPNLIPRQIFQLYGSTNLATRYSGECICSYKSYIVAFTQNNILSESNDIGYYLHAYIIYIHIIYIHIIFICI